MMEVNCKTSRTALNGVWRVRELSNDDIPPHNQIKWIPATVPGHVHLDLIAAGVITDPNVRMEERSAQWVDSVDWQYETTFVCTHPSTTPSYLLFHGLDTIAEVTLNGTLIGSVENMFIPHEFRVDHLLRFASTDDDPNVLQVVFRSAKNLGEKRLAEWNKGPDAITPQWDNWAPRAFVRKAQYMYGWDWGPVLISCGVWQDVELVTVPAARLLDWKYNYRQDGPTGTVNVQTVVDRADVGQDLTLKLSLGDTSSMVNIPAGDGECTVIADLRITEPQLWNPSGSSYGVATPTLYDLSTEIVTAGGETIDSRNERIGLRVVELLHEKDADGNGEGFQFRINGIPVFVKGANWIPNDSFPSTTNTTRMKSVRERITQARDAGYNMLRVWGGGLYETEQFYNICDELGLMVWQDFAYGCSYYPDTGDYAKNSEHEAVTAVKRIRNHASLVLWCGNNENNTMYQSNWGNLDRPRHVGEHLYHTILPAVVAKENPETPYWPSSPFGGDDLNSADFGDCHNWDVWHGRGDWIHYAENDSRFCSEFGFASSCGLPAWNSILAAEDRNPFSPVVRWHDKTRKGYETYLNYIMIHYPEIQTLEDLVYYSQINQAEALKFGVEHYRRRKGRCWGTLYWQINDCWPVQSWAVIDSLGEQKAAYYATKKFYSPVLVSLAKVGDTVAAHIISDLNEPIKGTLKLSLVDFDGAVLSEIDGQALVEPNSALIAATLDLKDAVGKEKHTFVRAEFVATDSAQLPVSSENIMFLAEPKNLLLSGSAPTVEVEREAEDALRITVTATTFTPYVWLRRSDDQVINLTDNFFHLLPGEAKSVSFIGDNLNIEQLKHTLVLRSLNDM